MVDRAIRVNVPFSHHQLAAVEIAVRVNARQKKTRTWRVFFNHAKNCFSF
jgi:hypothetical protein